MKNILKRFKPKEKIIDECLTGHKFEISNKFSLLWENGEIVAIRCETCKKVSYNFNDIKYKFCGFCDKFH